MIFVFCFFLFLIFELVYFRIADKYNIIDHPNERSSHSRITLRGGGIIFPIAILVGFFLNGQYIYFTAGILFISFISFWDDIKSLPNLFRISIHFLSVVLLIIQLNVSLPIYYYPLIFILIIGIINAYNFMDGINGITGAYSFIALLSLLYINSEKVQFTDNDLIVYLILGVMVFNIFNFRKKAKCFAGDIGSISIAFAICFLLSTLIVHTQDFKYILLLLIYGLDTVTTIIFRLIRKENIFKAHRRHFYQFLANEKGWPQLIVSGLYALSQLIINLLVIQQNDLSSQSVIGIIIVSGIIFVIVRFTAEGYIKLMRTR